MKVSTKTCWMICVAMLMPLWGCSSGPRNVPGQVAYGNPFAKHVKYLPENMAKGADIQAAKEKQMTKMSRETLERMGDAFHRKGRLNSAYLRYHQALAKDPENLDLHLKIGMVLLDGGHYEDALKKFTHVISAAPKTALAWQGRAMTKFHLQKFSSARSSFRRALALDQGLWRSHDYLGRIHDRHNDHAKARSAYRRAIAIAPGQGCLYNNLGVSYALSGFDKEAADAYRRAIELKYREGKVFNNLGLALARQGHFDLALAAFRQIHDEAGAYNNLGCVYMMQGKWDEAIRAFNRAIEVSPKFYTTADRNLKKAEVAARQF